MNDWKRVPAIKVNLFTLAAGPPGLLRLVFGEHFGKEGSQVFHGAVLISHDTARGLVDLLSRGLGQSGGGTDPGNSGSIIGNTAIH